MFIELQAIDDFFIFSLFNTYFLHYVTVNFVIFSKSNSLTTDAVEIIRKQFLVVIDLLFVNSDNYVEIDLNSICDTIVNLQ